MELKMLSRLFRKKEDVVHITDQKIIDSFLSNPDFPYLISFPRTGSHWLRMIMERYFEKPSLRRIFYYKDANDFTCYHWHDIDRSLVDVRNVMYLYREPVATVYSTLQYHGESIDDKERIAYWADCYGRHVYKWLLEENFTTKKTTIYYDNLKSNMNNEFEKVCQHIGYDFNADKLNAILKHISKDELKKKTGHDDKIVNLNDQYNDLRLGFVSDNKKFIYDVIDDIDKSITKLFY